MKSRHVPWSMGIIVLVLLSVAGCDLFGSKKSVFPNAPIVPDPGTTNRPPVSSIVLPYAAKVDQGVIVQNLATDPDGDAITAYRFRTPFQDVSQATKVATLTFPQAGKFAVSVSAKDSKEAWSPEVTDSIAISLNPPADRTLYRDDATLEPGAIGYDIGYPPNGDFSLVTSGGLRTMTYNYGNALALYGLKDWIPVPRGARLRFNIQFSVDADPVWVSAADDRGYAILELVFGRDGVSYGANYFVLATLDLDSDGFPGSPDRLENHFVPGQHVYTRVANGGWTSMDIDLDQLVATRFNTALNMGGFNQIWFDHQLKVFPSNGNHYRLKYVVDFIEVYVPGSAATNAPIAVARPANGSSLRFSPTR